MFLLIALSLFAQDPPPGEVISTAPPAAPAAALADPFAATPDAPRSGRTRLNSTVPVLPRTEAAASPAGDVEERWGFTLERPGDAPSPRLPARAYEDPIRYAAEACRAESRPADEDMRACYARIESTVAQSRPAAPPPRPRVQAPPRVRCEQRQSRDDDGRTSSTSARCTTGTGDAALLDDLLDWD